MNNLKMKIKAAQKVADKKPKKPVQKLASVTVPVIGRYTNKAQNIAKAKKKAKNFSENENTGYAAKVTAKKVKTTTYKDGKKVKTTIAKNGKVVRERGKEARQGRQNERKELRQERQNERKESKMHVTEPIKTGVKFKMMGGFLEGSGAKPSMNNMSKPAKAKKVLNKSKKD